MARLVHRPDHRPVHRPHKLHRLHRPQRLQRLHRPHRLQRPHRLHRPRRPHRLHRPQRLQRPHRLNWPDRRQRFQRLHRHVFLESLLRPEAGGISCVHFAPMVCFAACWLVLIHSLLACDIASKCRTYGRFPQMRCSMRNWWINHRIFRQYPSVFIQLTSPSHQL